MTHESNKSDEQELINLRELVISGSIQKDALVRILIEKGVFTQEEFNETLKELQSDYGD